MANRSHELPRSWLNTAGLGLELGSLPGLEGKARISLSKGSHDQKVAPNLSAGGFPFVNECALAEVFSPGSLGQPLVQSGE